MGWGGDEMGWDGMRWDGRWDAMKMGDGMVRERRGGGGRGGEGSARKAQQRQNPDETHSKETAVAKGRAAALKTSQLRF